MEADERQPADSLNPAPGPELSDDYEAFLRRLEQAPYRFDFFTTLRRIEGMHPGLPRLGTATTPGQEPIRIGQESSLTFAPAALSRLRRARGSGRPWLLQRILGLLGPNGALPTHLTEYAHEREMHHGDVTFARFLDLLTHRVALQFYRAWAQAQPILGPERPADNRHAVYVGALCGEAQDLRHRRTALPHDAVLYFAGRLARAARSADGLGAWIGGYLGCDARVESFVVHWMPVESAGLTRLGGHTPAERATARLGAGASLGARVRDAQHKFRVSIGPVRASAYAALLPGGHDLAALKALVRRYSGLEYAWDVRLSLDARDVPPLVLGRPSTAGRPTDPAGIARLGYGTWLGRRRSEAAADDLLLDPELARG